ncbi:alpha/beta fold hydrolase [Ekhidna sp.]
MKQLILIHGAIGGADQLVPLQEQLKDDFEIHLLEFAGHGRLASDTDEFSIDSFNSQLNHKLDEIGEPSHVFGYSMGGFIALLNAADNSGKIKSLVTLGTKMEWSSEIAGREVKQLNPDVIESKVPKFAQALERRHGGHWKELLSKTADFMLQLGEIRPMQEAVLVNIKIPVKLCLADQDHMVSQEETLQVAQWIANCDFELIRDSKHPIEQVDLMVLASTIKSFAV